MLCYAISYKTYWIGVRQSVSDMQTVQFLCGGRRARSTATHDECPRKRLPVSYWYLVSSDQSLGCVEEIMQKLLKYRPLISAQTRR